MHTTPSLLWTLEEISRLVSRQRQPLRDADQHRPPDSAAVRHRRLLGLPARARSRQPGAGRHDRPAAGERRPRPHAARRRARRPGRRAAAAAWSSPTRRRIRASSTSARPARIRTASFLGVPLIDRGAAPGRAGRADDRAARVRATTTCGCWRRPARSWRRSSARRARSGSSSRRRTSGWPRWRRTCGGAGTTTRPACSASSIRCSGASCDHNPVALLQQIPIDAARGARVAAGAAQPHQLRLPPAAGVPARRRTPGARATPACSGRGRSPTSRPSSACTSRCRSTPAASASSPAITSRARRDLGIPLVGVGLYYDQGYFRQRLDRDGWQHEDYLDVDSRLLPIAAGDWRDGEPVTVEIETRTGTIVARVWQVDGRPQHAAAARLQRRRQPARRTASSPRGSTAATTASASARSCCSASAASARCGAGHRARRRCT